MIFGMAGISSMRVTEKSVLMNSGHSDRNTFMSALPAALSAHCSGYRKEKGRGKREGGNELRVKSC